VALFSFGVDAMDDLRRVKLRLSRALRKAFEAHEEIFLRSLVKGHHAPPRGAWWRQPRQRQSVSLPADLRITISQATAETAASLLVAIHDALQQAMRSGARATIAAVGIRLTFTLAHPQAVQYLDRRADIVIEQINSTLHERIARLSKRRASAHIERDLRRLYRDMAHKWSRHIAATIVTDAHQAGSAIVIRDLQSAGIRVAQCSGLVSSLGS
jgi:hypothetical protein